MPPGVNETYRSVTFDRTGTSSANWPKLSCSDANRLDLDVSDLRLDSDRALLFEGNGQIRTAGALRIFTNTPTPTEKLTILASGEVGIGTPTPTAQLEVNGTVKATDFQGDGSSLAGVIKTLDSVVSKAGDTITGALTINNALTVSGNVGIGAATPTAKLHIYSTDNALKITNTTVSKSASMGVDDLGVWIEPSETNSSIRLNANPSLVGLFIKGTDGRIGVGTRDPQASLHVVGNLLGAAKGSAGEAYRIAVGRTPPGATNWIQYDPANTGMYVDIDTSSAGFSAIPYYFTSLGGISSHWDTQGATSIYLPTATGFRVYVYSPGKTVAQANGWQWHIQWLAIGT